MPRDQVAAELVAERKGFLEVHRTGPVESVVTRGSFGHVGREAASFDRGDGKADALDADRVADRDPVRSKSAHSTSSGRVRTIRPTACTIPVNMRRRVTQKARSNGYCDLCQSAPIRLSSEGADAASAKMNTPTAMEFAAATLEAKSSIQGAQISQMPAPRFSHSTGRSSSPLHSKCERENKSHRYRVPCRSRLLGIARDPRR